LSHFPTYWCDSLYYRRHVSPEQIRQVLQAHREGSSLRGISRTSGLAYTTVVSIVRSASPNAQLVHHQEVQSVETEEVCADEMWSFVANNRSNAPARNATGATVGLV
jgi:lambda repressor-like predicted transcriptional regulator